MLRLLIVEDHPVVRASLASVLSRAAGMDVVGVAASGEEAVELFGSLAPDVVLLDYQLPGRNGARICAEILARNPEAAVVIHSIYADPDVIEECRAAGARGYVLKDALASDVAAAVRAALREDD